MKKIFILLIISPQLLGNIMQPFSLKKVDALAPFQTKRASFIKASDGINLAYYSFIAKNPKATVIFYHGAGLYASTVYQFFAKELSEKHSINCYLFDVRGHGDSEGKRGDGPSITQVWNDVTTAINFTAEQHSSLPLFIGGHSSGAGMVLNYSNYYSHPSVNGYLLIAPYLGRNSGTLKDHADPATSFVKSIRVWVFILNALSRGYLFGHIPAIYFNYPDQWIEKDHKIVNYATATMIATTAPENPQELFSKTDKPFAIFAAEHDEQFIAEKTVDYLNHARSDIQEKSQAVIIPDTQHIDILLSSAGYCAEFIHGIK